MIARRIDTSYSRWVGGVVGAGLVSLLSFLAIRDRISIDVSLVRLQAVIESQSAILAKHEVELQLLKTNLNYLSDQNRSNGVKLDAVLVEVKKAKR